jgi:hypothetical protein
MVGLFADRETKGRSFMKWPPTEWKMPPKMELVKIAAGWVIGLSCIYYVFIKDAPPWREGLRNITTLWRQSHVKLTCVDLNGLKIPLSCTDFLGKYKVPPGSPAWEQPKCYETDGEKIIWLCEDVYTKAKQGASNALAIEAMTATGYWTEQEAIDTLARRVKEKSIDPR